MNRSFRICRSRIARSYLSALKSLRRLIRVDARGHGASDKPHDPSAYNLDFRVADVTAVLDDLDIRQTDYFGFSMGDWIGFGLAMYAPIRIRSLILGGAHPYAENMQVFRDLMPQDSWRIYRNDREGFRPSYDSGNSGTSPGQRSQSPVGLDPRPGLSCGRTAKDDHAVLALRGRFRPAPAPSARVPKGAQQRNVLLGTSKRPFGFACSKRSGVASCQYFFGRTSPVTIATKRIWTNGLREMHVSGLGGSMAKPPMKPRAVRLATDTRSERVASGRPECRALPKPLATLKVGSAVIDGKAMDFPHQPWT